MFTHHGSRPINSGQPHPKIEDDGCKGTVGNRTRVFCELLWRFKEDPGRTRLKLSQGRDVVGWIRPLGLVLLDILVVPDVVVNSFETIHPFRTYKRPHRRLTCRACGGAHTMAGFSFCLCACLVLSFGMLWVSVGFRA
ncbi:hypothetical protein CPC08DRAFT_706324 [Agrocybe pediades]|nr:hypothetical protein CPC08DRAFT_706324 [Agrocybe pediades]